MVPEPIGCPICDDGNPPWWPSQLQGDPWDRIQVHGLSAPSTQQADGMAVAIAAHMTRRDADAGWRWSLVPVSEVEIYRQAIVEYRRRFEADGDGMTIGDDGVIAFPEGLRLWLRLLRFDRMPRKPLECGFTVVRDLEAERWPTR